MTDAEEWRTYIAELRSLAEQTADAERQQRLFALAERWAEFVDEFGARETSEGAPRR